jgi:hypothetical protein
MGARLRASLIATVTLALGCAAIAAASSSGVLDAPAATASRAAADARASLDRITLPAGSRRLPVAPPGLRGPLEPDFTMGYRTFRTATEYWRLATAADAAQLLAQAPVASTTWSDPGGVRGAQIALAPAGPWIGPRWLVIEIRPDPSTAGAWLAELQAVAVWTPWRLEIPADVASVTVTRLQDGAKLATVSAPAQVAQIVAAVNGLAVDDAVDAVFSSARNALRDCPALLSGKKPGFALSFDAASGTMLASANTEWCPADLALRVASHAPQQLILGDLVARLQGILGITLPPAF